MQNYLNLDYRYHISILKLLIFISKIYKSKWYAKKDH